MVVLLGRLAGIGLVEVLVALSIVVVNVVGWTATLHVVLSLVRRIGELSSGLDPAFVVEAACGLGCLVPRAMPPGIGKAAARVRGRACSRHLRGVSLSELLVALAVGAIVLAGMAAATFAAGRAARGAAQTLDAAAVRAALPALLREVVETAGRGMPSACGLAIGAESARLDVRHTLGDGSIVVDEVFAGLDGGGLPALYLRRFPHVRQPWIEDVTAFSVDHIDAVEGGQLGPSRSERIVLRVAHAALDQPLDVDIELPHRPCLEFLP